MAERFKAAHLKCAIPKGIVGSNPTPSANAKRNGVRHSFVHLVSAGGVRTPELFFSVEKKSEAVPRAPTSDGEEGTRGRIPPPPPRAVVCITDVFSLYFVG